MLSAKVMAPTTVPIPQVARVKSEPSVSSLGGLPASYQYQGISSDASIAELNQVHVRLAL